MFDPLQLIKMGAGGRQYIEINLSTPQSGVNLYTAAGSPTIVGLPLVVVNITAAINGRSAGGEGATILADSNFPANTIYLINNGTSNTVHGEGGDGGNGGDAESDGAGSGFAEDGFPGEDGAHGIEFTNAAIVVCDNLGAVRGGGAGGGGGGAGSFFNNAGATCGGGGGGGGVGSPAGTGGQRGSRNGVLESIATDGTAGNDVAPTGTPGTGGLGATRGVIVSGAGGNGADWAAAATAGGAGSGVSASGAAGAAGVAGRAFRLVGGGSVKFINRGTIAGVVDNEVV
ncbi:MAG: hypothetical protein QNJ97_17865 [Myxococcota bacterium]|nr:hypothetical protein [Myxococcota bacterium]